MKRYGLIGYPLSHSFSQRYFTQKFEQEPVLSAIYENYAIADISELSKILDQYKDLCGFNITIPYKKDILSFLSASSAIVKEMGACNCVKIEKGKLIGHNTDVIGFEKSLEPWLRVYHERALILGSGGAAAAVAYVFKKRKIPFQFVSRKKNNTSLEYANLSEEVMMTHQIIVNATPLGMSPKIDEFAPIPYHWMSEKHHCFDLIYNPAETLFLQKAKEAGATTQNGAEMLIIQAEESWRIWNEMD